jgi:hypothetical protein
MTSESLRAIQTGLRGLGYDPGPIDGRDGPRTRGAAAAFGNGVAATAPPRAAPGGLVRIIWHWTGGSWSVSALDRSHYHFVIAGDGEVVKGTLAPEDNISVADGVYSPHTLNANTGAIGVAVAAMGGALERPFGAGAWPLREVQLEALARLTAQLCGRYGIAVSRTTTLSHAEVQPTLKIAQRGKWDIAWLPGMGAPSDPVAIGDRLRARVTAFLTP